VRLDDIPSETPTPTRERRGGGGTCAPPCLYRPAKERGRGTDLLLAGAEAALKQRVRTLVRAQGSWDLRSYGALDGAALGPFVTLSTISYPDLLGTVGICGGPGPRAESLNWVNEMLASAEASGDPDLLIEAHEMACTTHFWRGDLTQSHAHGDRVLALYDEEQHRHLADLKNIDPKTTVGVYDAPGTWMRGYPDRAVQLCDAKDAHARRRGHPFDLGFALTVGSQVWDYRCKPEQMLARVEEAERLGRAHSLPFIFDVMAQFRKGLTWLRTGHLAEGITQLRDAMETWSAHGGGSGVPYYRAVLAEGLALSGDLAGGLSLIEDSLTQIARPGWEERLYLAEVLRLKGRILVLQGNLAGAEQIPGFARLGTPATSKVLGITHLDQPRPPVAATGKINRSSRNVSCDLWLVHRRV
jgi:hypothetical protein